MARRWVAALLAGLSVVSCGPGEPSELGAEDARRVVAEVEAAVWAFHAADTARDAEAVLALLWPDYTMLGDGARMTYDEVAARSRAFMASLDLFHTVWTDLRITALGRDVAVSSFQFRDSILTRTGQLTRSQGPTTFVWQRRDDEWRVIFANADHYPIEP